MWLLSILGCSVLRSLAPSAPPCVLVAPPASARPIGLGDVAEIEEAGTLCDPAARGLVTMLRAISPTQILAGRRGADAVVWDLPTGRGVPLTGSGEISGVAVGADGTLYTASIHGTVEAREPASPHAVRWSAHPSWGQTWGIAPLPGGDVVVGSNTGTLARLGPAGNTVASTTGWRMIWGVRALSDDELLVSEMGSGLRRVSTKTLDDSTVVPTHGSVAWQADATANGTVAVASEGRALVLTGDAIDPVGEHRGTVREVAFSPDGTLLALATSGGSLVIVETATRERLAEFPADQGRVQTLAWSPDSTWIATGGDGGLVRIWQVVHRTHPAP
jgi:WD40 repeat protein